MVIILNIKRKFFIHRLVAECFIQRVENKPDVNHIDLNKENNDVKNLEWCNCHENNKHAQDNGVGTAAIPQIVFTKKGEFFGEFSSKVGEIGESNLCNSLIFLNIPQFSS